MRLTRKAQSVLEYIIVFVVVIAAMLSMQVYIKRGFQGRWKEAVDQVGEQWDPRNTKGSITHVMTMNGGTRVTADGKVTMRYDDQKMTETQIGTLTTTR